MELKLSSEINNPHVPKYANAATGPADLHKLRNKYRLYVTC